MGIVFVPVSSEEFTESNVPGISLPTRRSETLNDTSPIPPKFSVIPVTENSL